MLALGKIWTDFTVCGSFLWAGSASAGILKLLSQQHTLSRRAVLPKIPGFQAGWMWQSVADAVTAALEVRSVVKEKKFLPEES